MCSSDLEHVYFHAVKTSCELAKKDGSHAAYGETRASQGDLQYDLWGADPSLKAEWAALKEEIAEHGLRNSLICAIAPTATIASIAGCYECIEPQVSNLFKRETLSGDFVQVNNYLVEDLKERGLWNEGMRGKIKQSEGSIGEIEEIPADVNEQDILDFINGAVLAMTGNPLEVATAKMRPVYSVQINETSPRSCVLFFQIGRAHV